MRSPWDHRFRLIACVFGLLLGGHWLSLARAPAASESQDVELAVYENIAAALTERTGAVVARPATEVRAVDAVDSPPSLFGWRSPARFVALATPPGRNARDLYRMEARLAPNGRVIELSWAVNLTRSSQADDARLAVSGLTVATAVVDDHAIAAVEVRDFRGEDPVLAGTSEWPAWQQAANRITNLEQTGQREGIGLTHFTLEQPLPEAGATLEASGDVVTLASSGGVLSARIASGVPATYQGGSLTLVASAPEQKMQMDLLNWVADRGRGFADQGLAPAWLGQSVELAKEVYFTAKEVKATVDEMAPAAPEEGRPLEAPAEVEARDEAVEQALELARRQAKESDFPWPPPPLEPMLTPPWDGEGLWKPVGPERLSPDPSGAPLMYETFLRPSDEYQKKSVHFYVWDPRRLELRMRGGTQEPIPQTANRGDGKIPRDPDVLGRLVAAFNGGFQTTHTEFGMMVDRKVLLKPRSLGATVALLEDGRTAFGTWKKGEPIPPEFVSLRQNLEPLIEDRIFNAYHRTRFGAHENVAGAKDGWTVRSAICHTASGHLIYAYAEYVNERALATVLLRAGCVYAIHLDMNPGHTGFEFYRQLGPTDKTTGPFVARTEPSPIDSANVRDVAGIQLEGVLPHPRIRHMNRPTRYIATDYRDFFFLVRRKILPGAPLDGPNGPAAWETTTLPHGHEVPPHLARTTLATAGGGSLEILLVDPSGTTLSVGEAPGASEYPLLASVPWPEQAGVALPFGTIALSGAPLTNNTATVAAFMAFGVDRDGMGLFLRAQNAAPAAALAVMTARGVTAPVMVTTSAPVWLYDEAARPDGTKALLELEPGRDQGVVVAAPSTTDRRLFVFSKPWPDRIKRYWPDANPYKKPK